jgi:hypothetical protein
MNDKLDGVLLQRNSLQKEVGPRKFSAGGFKAMPS